MLKSARSTAEEKFAATQKKDKRILKEREKAWQKTLEHTARLKALRLAKEAVDKEEAEKAAAEKAAAKTKNPSKTSKTHHRKS